MEFLLQLATPLELGLRVFSQNIVTNNLVICMLVVAVGFVASKKHGSKTKSWKTSKQVIPTPPALPIIGHLYLVASSGDLLTFMTSMFSKYGKIWRVQSFGSDCVFVGDANMIQKILANNSPHINKPKSLNDTFPLDSFKHGLFTSEGELWKNQRKILSEAFTFSALKGYVGLIDKHAKNLVHSMASRPFDFHSIIHNEALELITDTVFGPEICNDPDDGEKFLQLTNRLLTIIGIRFGNPWLLLRPLWKLHPARQEMKSVIREMEYIAAKKIDSFQQAQASGLSTGSSNNNKDSSSGTFRSMMETMVNSGMSKDLILVECITMLMAGHETVSKSLEHLMLHLASHPYHQIRCQEEIDQIAEKIKPNSFTVDMNSMSELKHLEKCIKESSRLTPVTPFSRRELISPLKLDEDIELAAGTNVFVSTWTLHKDPDYFPNPEKFDPDRFSTENIKKLHPYAFLPFSAGKRNCIGWKLGIMELKAFSAWILRHYQVETNDRLEDITFEYGLSIKSKRNIRFVFKKRQVLDM